jgi:hypothetical protein
MEINHHLGINGDHDKEFFNEVNRLGLKYEVSPLPNATIGLVTFDIEEADPRWEAIQKMIDLYGAFNLIETYFTPEEILQSEWNRLLPTYEWGYPQPENNMKWEQLALSGMCPNCGAGYTQIAPLRMKRDPKLGRQHLFSLYWMRSFFCKHEVIDALKENQINGYEVWEAVIHSTNQPSTLVSQLLFPEVTAPGLFEGDKNRPEHCSECGVTKYGYHNRGKLRLHQEAIRDADFQMIHEWFGSGRKDAFREVIVSNRVARLILSKGWRGVRLKPVDIV